jgi:LmeA-like phospholipid-binding
MRKILLLGALLVIAVWVISPASLLAETGLIDVQQQTPQLSNPLSRMLQGLLGFNRVAAWMGSRRLEQAIHKKVSGDIHVHLFPYSGFDLLHGRAKRLEIKGDNLLYHHAFYVSHFELETDKNTPLWVDMDHDKIKSPLEADVSIGIQQSDINRSFETPYLKSKLQHIRVPIIGAFSPSLELLEPQVSLLDQRVQFKTKLSASNASPDKAIPIAIETGVDASGNTPTIHLKDFSIQAPIPGLSNTAVENLLEKGLQSLLNPEKLIPFKGGTFEIRTLTVSVSSDGIHIKGHIRIAPTALSSSS